MLVPAGAAGGQEPSTRRTPDGQPDIQGVWTNLDRTPLEAASAEAWRDLDALALWFPGINAPDGRLTGPNPISGLRWRSDRQTERRAALHGGRSA